MKMFYFVISAYLSLSSALAYSDFPYNHYNSNDNYDKTIYGNDDRTDILTVTDQLLLNLAQATAAMIPRKSLYYHARKGVYELKQYTSLKEQKNMCKDEMFVDQPSVAVCTGLLIKPDVILTAGHCMLNESSCDDSRWVFDYKMLSNKTPKRLYANRRVYQCKKILHLKFDSENSIDYALVQLHRPAYDRIPFKISSKVPQVGTQVMMMGHPSGLPFKIASGPATIQKVNQYSFKANIDSFAGNSGSPVLDRSTQEVLGILVSGDTDYIFDSQDKCYRAYQCSESTCKMETISSIENLKHLL